MPGQQASGVSTQANWISQVRNPHKLAGGCLSLHAAAIAHLTACRAAIQLLGGLVGPGGAAAGSIPPLGTPVGAMPGVGPSTGQQVTGVQLHQEALDALRTQNLHCML